MLIQTHNLVKMYKEKRAVAGVSIQVNQGEIVGLLGPNGAGKTTTFYMIVGIEHPDEGSICIGNQDITGLPIHKRAAYGIGYLPQEASIFRKLTVEDNLLAMLETTKLSKREQRRKAEALMEEFSIIKLRKRLGIQLSGGERRRVEIARCLVMDPASGHGPGLYFAGRTLCRHRPLGGQRYSGDYQPPEKSRHGRPHYGP